MIPAFSKRPHTTGMRAFFILRFADRATVYRDSSLVQTQGILPAGYDDLAAGNGNVALAQP